MLFDNQFKGLKPLTPDEYLSESRAAWSDFTENAKSIYEKGLSSIQKNGLPLDEDNEGLALNKQMIDLITRHSQAQLEYSLRLMYGMPYFMNFNDALTNFVTPQTSASAKSSPKAKAKPKATSKTTEEAPATSEKSEPELIEKPDGQPDELTRIKGIGPKLSEKLNGLGIYNFSQISKWTEKEIAWVDDKLSFKGRIEREKWIEQAKDLM